jgi:sortase A
VVLAAHDVTWFSQIDNLEPGTSIEIAAPCWTYEYKVSDHRIITSGTPIYVTNVPSLVLITCYPLDALFLTPQRYIVNATLTSVKAKSSEPAVAPVAPVTPAVSVPPALAAQGLDLAHNPAPMGSLAVTGSPSPSWSQSAAPLEDENAVMELYLAALHSAEQSQPEWWSDFAPSVPWSKATVLSGGGVTRNNMSLSPQLNVSGNRLVSATLTSKPTVTVNGITRTYLITMTASPSDGSLIITDWNATLS